MQVSLAGAAIRVLVGEGEVPVRGALAALVAGEPDMLVVGEASAADQAVDLAAELRPDVAVVDEGMSGGGPSAARGIRDQSPHTRVLALSAHQDQGTVLEMLQAGVVGYLMKGISATEIVEAIRRAVRDQSSLSVDVVSALISALSANLEKRRQAEAEVRRSEERFHSLLQKSPDAVVITDDSGLIALLNNEAERLFGYTRRELIGKPIETLLPERLRQDLAADRAHYVADARPRPLATERGLFGLRKDGSEFPADISLSAIQTDEGPVVTSHVRDTTEDKPAQESQRKSEARFAAAFIRDMTERQAQADLERDLAERKALLAHLVNAGEEQRRQIANDIHDDSIQVIAAAGLRLEILRRKLDDPEQLALLGDLEQTIKLAVSRLRHLLFELRPPSLDNEGLSAALEVYLAESARESEERYRLEDRLSSQPDERTRVILYRIAQEAITNVRKHARAANVTVSLGERDGGYVVQIADDGRGFSANEAKAVAGHIGLAAMRERATLAGGWLTIDSEPGQGTKVEAWVPAASEGAQASTP